MNMWPPKEEYYDANETREEYMDRMKAEGFDVILPKPNELLIDIDDLQMFTTFKKQLLTLEKNGIQPDYSIYQSRSGYPGRHVRLIMPFDMDNTERIAWQAALGSDPVRELLSLTRMKKGDVYPTLFVERKEVK